MSLGLIFWIAMQNFAAIRSAVPEKMTFEVAIFGFSDIPDLKFSLLFWVMEGRMWRCKNVRLAELPFLHFYKSKTRGETQFWIELAALFILANNNEINSDETLPFIIILTPISCDGSNRFWRQRLLPSPCFLWRHKQTLVGVIRPLAGGKCQTFHRVNERYRYLCFHCVFCVRGFFLVYCFVRTERPYRTKTVFILIALKVLI